jgi:N-acetylglucosaminyldiphosphoundecaprenol N-acetyl-beta-D-mannosaminyltransferase
LGAPIDRVTGPELLEYVRERVANGPPAWAATVNVEYVMRARSDAAFLALLEQANLATADSYGILWALRRRGIDLGGRVGGSDLIWSIPAQASAEGHGVFLLGGRPGVAAAAGNRLAEAFPSLRICGTHSGSPSSEDEDAIVDLIRQSKADILFVAYGSPRQDYWIARNLARSGVSFAMGVGGSLDYVAGRARRAPRWMRERGLEWTWRLMREPWRWKRMLAIPRFAWLVWREDQGVAGKGDS